LQIFACFLQSYIFIFLNFRIIFLQFNVFYFYIFYNIAFFQFSNFYNFTFYNFTTFYNFYSFTFLQSLRIFGSFIVILIFKFANFRMFFTILHF